MSQRPRTARLLVSIASLGLVLACSIFTPGSPEPGVTPLPLGPSATESVPGEEGPVPEPPPAGEGLAEQVERGVVTLEDVTSSGEIAGPGIDVVVGNPGPETVQVIIPCGFTFAPDNSEDQRLMVVQPVSASVPAGGQASLNAYVVCIDSHNDAPSEGSGYSLGTMQTGDLLRLAQCACGEDLAASQDPFAGMGVMIAGWMISNGQSFSEMLTSESQGAMDQYFGEGSGEAFAGFLSFLEDPANAWLDRCGITLP